MRSPGGYRTAAQLPLGDGQQQTFTVQALNQDGMSQESASMTAVASGPTPPAP